LLTLKKSSAVHEVRAWVCAERHTGNLRNINNKENYRSHLLRATEAGSLMSKKKKKESGPMPAASAGLLRFFEEETEGVKIRPELLVVFSVALMVLSVLAQVFFPV
jgi:preprotein translocase subunit Sec61beta